jgi:hypothetical protein
MTLALSSIYVRSPSRLRLSYTQPLGYGAAVASWFSLACLDSSTADPVVRVVYGVSYSATELELALTFDLAQGGSYQLTSLAGIPDADGGFSELEVTGFRVPIARPAPSPSLSANDVGALLYGVDLLHDRGDFVETADGDLAVISGPDNAIGAIVRIGLSDGLPYDSTYGAKLRKYVDAPSPSAKAARGDLEKAIRRDDRVKRVVAAVAPDANDGDLTIQGDVTLIGKTKHSFSREVT